MTSSKTNIRRVTAWLADDNSTEVVGDVEYVGGRGMSTQLDVTVVSGPDTEESRQALATAWRDTDWVEVDRQAERKPLPPSRALAQSRKGREARGLRRLEVWLPEVVMVALDDVAERRGVTRAALVTSALSHEVRAELARMGVTPTRGEGGGG